MSLKVATKVLTRTEISSESSTGDGSTFKVPQVADRIIFFVTGHRIHGTLFLKAINREILGRQARYTIMDM